MMYQVFFYTPESHLELIKQAMFAAGGGRIGHYEACAWQTAGQGRFRPMAGATPFIGAVDALEDVHEFRVEMVCEDARVKDVVAALRAAHPYEEPAFGVLRLEDV